MSIPRLRNVLNWLPAALAVAMIAFESTATMSASNTSRWLLPIWEHLFGPITPERWAVIHHYIRKTGHFTGYGVVSLCFFHGWRTTLRITNGVRALWVRSSIFAVGCTILVASADEYHQTFVPGRTGRVFDVGIDTCGAITAQLLILALMPLLIRRAKERFLGTLASEVE
jgi:VanZ family protein